MNNLTLVKKSDIILFDPNPKDRYQNHLKNLIYFLKTKGHQGTIDFSHSDGINSLHPNLSIKENFILDSIPTSLIRDNEKNLSDFLNQMTNPYLKNLIELVGDLDKKVADLEKPLIGLTAFIKVLISPSENLFLIKPEHEQSHESLILMKKTIDFECQNQSRKFYIHSEKEEVWIDLISKIVYRDSLGHYTETLNQLNNNSSPEEVDKHFQFTLLKAS